MKHAAPSFHPNKSDIQSRRCTLFNILATPYFPSSTFPHDNFSGSIVITMSHSANSSW